MTIYQPPDTPEVEEVLCIKVLVPLHQKYLSAFWSAYTYFGKWVAWERDGSDRATRAAQLWRGLIEQSREMYEVGDSCGGEDMQVRQNPTMPCRLEYNVGDGWVEFANLTLCSGGDGTTAARFPDGMDDTQRSQYIANVLEAMSMMWRNQGVGYSFSAIITTWNTYGGLLKNMLGPKLYTQAGIFESLLAEPDAVTYKSQLDSLNADIWRDLAQYIACQLEDDGHWLDRIAGALFEWLNQSSDWLHRALSAAFQPWGFAELEAAGGGGAGFSGNPAYLFPSGLECSWCVHYDFATGQHGWLPDENIAGYVPRTAATYVFGTGYRGIWQVGLGYDTASCFIYIDFGQEVSFTRVKMTCQTSDGPYGVGQAVAFRLGRFEGGEIFFTAPMSGGPETFEWVSGEGVKTTDILSVQHASIDQSDVSNMWIYSIEIEGISGDIPEGGETCPE